MATHLGNSGLVKAATNTIGELTKFAITETAGATDDTVIGDTAKTFKSDETPAWTANVAGWYDPSDTGQGQLVAGATLAFEFDMLGTANTKPKWSGSAIVTSLQTGDVAQGGVIPFSAQLQGSGALTKGTHSA